MFKERLAMKKGEKTALIIVLCVLVSLCLSACEKPYYQVGTKIGFNEQYFEGYEEGYIDGFDRASFLYQEGLRQIHDIADTVEDYSDDELYDILTNIIEETIYYAELER